MMTKEMQDLCERNYKKVERYVRSRVKGMEAEDVIQEVFLVALQKKESVIHSQNPTGWLINAAKFKILESERSSRPGVLSLDGMEYEVTDGSNNLEMIEWLTFMRQILSDTECELLIQIGLEGRNFREMAETEGVSQEKLRRYVKGLQERLRRMK